MGQSLTKFRIGKTRFDLLLSRFSPEHNGLRRVHRKLKLDLMAGNFLSQTKGNFGRKK
jgi:hypothetical protein